MAYTLTGNKGGLIGNVWVVGGFECDTKGSMGKMWQTAYSEKR
jgi:hypothetical protein